MVVARSVPFAAAVLGAFLWIGACGERLPGERTEGAGGAPDVPAARGQAAPRTTEEAFELSEEAWRARLTPEQYEITRRKGTERAFTGRYWNTFTPGTYRCVCCGRELFDASTKFDAGCGWPSFTAPIGEAAVEETRDTRHGMIRTEVTCRHCGAHLGHVFEDGPGPTGQRYCINSASLDLETRAADDLAPTDDADADSR